MAARRQIARSAEEDVGVTETLEAAPSTTVSDERRRRVWRAATREQKIALVAVAVVVCVVVSTGGARPTGVFAVDLAYRYLAGMGMVLAGSRARRWSLVTGSAIVTGAALGAYLVIGALALALAVTTIVRNRRDRVWGGAIGGVALIVANHLEVDAFLGASTLVAAVGCGVIVVSGYRNTRTVARRRVVRAVIVLAGVWILGIVVAGIVAALAYTPLRSAVASADDAVGAFQGGEGRAGAGELRDAAASFADGHRAATAVWSWPSRLVPVVAQHVTALAELSGAGQELSMSATRVGERVDYDELRRPDGGIDLDRLASFAEPIVDADRAVAAARQTVEDVSSPWLLTPVGDEIRRFDDRLERAGEDLSLASAAVRGVPSLMGGTEVRRYVVLLGNPAESRDLGGHIGNWAELTVDAGGLDLVRVGLPLELSQFDVPESELVDMGIPESLRSLQPARYPQNWGGHLDFPTDGRLAARLFEEATGRSVDGVLYADPSVVKAMLEVTGPVTVPVSGRKVTASNVVQFLTRDQFTELSGSEGDAAVTELVRRVFDTFTHARLPAPERIASLFGPAVREGRLRFMSIHVEDGELLQRLGLDYGLPRADDSAAFLGVVHSNANPSKIDAFLHRSVTVRSTWDPSTGDLTHHVTVELRNDAPASGLPTVVIGNQNGLPDGTNTLMLALLSNSKDLDSVTVDGRAAPVLPLDDGAGFRHQVRVDVAPGSTAKVEFVLRDQVDAGASLQLFVAGQPTLNPDPMVIEVTSTESTMVRQSGLAVSGRRARVSVPGDENSRISLRVTDAEIGER